LAASCHRQFAGVVTYNKAECAKLQNTWTLPQAHYDSSSSIMAPFFANQSCDPFNDANAPCVDGTYVQYSVDVSKPQDIAATIKFAQDKNIRLVIRNTGHDYNGKSTGAGALAVWTHHLKDIKIIDYKSAAYTGKAIQVGAGVQGFEAVAAANASGLAVVTGECPTVGYAGGYTQGGGHSALASRYGLAADQTLEFEVVDGTGRLMTATRDKNPDMFWALSGGGGGTYGVVSLLATMMLPLATN
jgi:FAD/FMN-containing dehydrogenase